MDKPLFSEHWYRVKTLRPKLRPHTRLHRHEYRGVTGYVLEDSSCARYHRFNAAAHRVIGLMNGQRTVEQIWEQVNTLLGDDAPVQDDIIHLLGQLHQIDVLQTDISPDLEEMFSRGQLHEQQQRRGRFKNPLALRIGLFDPDKFLNATMDWVRPLYSWPFLFLWCVLLLTGGLLAGAHWAELAETAETIALSPVNLVLMWLIYPVIKLVHELAHAYATKLNGGEVHEMGIIFLVFIPVPYVDASAATAFFQRRKRMLVGAAGVMAELLLAGLALFLWLAVEPGIVSSICFNTLLIGSVSTVLFNGNPLLRFDGYYVLADAVEIPNLASRANQYLAYLVKRYLLGLAGVSSPATSSGETRWFLFFAISSFCYRMSILAVICLFLLEKFFILGVLLVIWTIYSQVGLPLLKQLHFVFFDASVRRHRGRAVWATALCFSALAWLLVLLPVSSLTRFEGVISPPDETQLIARTDGFFDQLLAPPGTIVSPGQPLIRLKNALHQGDMSVKKARMRELNAEFRAARVKDRVKTQLVQEEISALRGEIEQLQGKLESLVIVSPGQGVFVLPQADDLAGQFIHQGKPLGYVINDERAVARVVVTQEDQDRITQRFDAVELRLVSDIDTVLQGRVVRAVPQASHQLPSKVLSVEGGGLYAPDPTGLTELSTRARLFEYEIELPLSLRQAMIGSRIYVRFDHGSETLWAQFSRRARQLFLSRLNA